ncbi:ACP S-malonyltransferase [Streptomyces sp. CRN 30]|uniref:ACP S-malonyltransferase n=1 Tax=Streptomyces sp. CRN 30 TaxID=3075613 RepID=UPI002A7F06C0|nr:acyltransferase domain-containing protein [Streptomyces sp. CRN 30]
MCPGQGAYLPGALRHLRYVPAVAEVLTTVDTHAPAHGSLRVPVGRLLTEEDAPAPEELLRSDPLGFDLATYAAVVASATVLLGLTRHRVDAVLGHSVGDLAALTVAGAVTVRQGVQLLRIRDRLLRTAALPAAGILATDTTAGQAADLIRACGTPQVRIAARNAPAQVVLAGPDAQLAHVRRALEDSGHRVTPLTSRTAFHHPLLDEVHRSFRSLLRAQPLARPVLPVHTTAGRWATTPAHLRTTAAAHLTEPMELHRTLLTLRRAGFTTFIDSGPRALLSGLVRAGLPGCATAAPLRTPVAADRILRRLNAVAPPRRPGPGPW